MRAVRTVALGLAASLLLGGCFAPGSGNEPVPAGTLLPTPQSSLSPQVDATVALIRQALAQVGLQLNPPTVPYRPSEPADLTTAPRAVFQESVADADQGYVLIYDLQDTATATARGDELASYLGSGFGQTNYTLDTQFAISQVGGTIVFTWWSASRASNPALAESAFDAVASVGQPIPVTK